MSTATEDGLTDMPSYRIVVALPTADRSRAYAFAQNLGLETPGELADDGVPEPLRVQLNELASVMYIPTGGFGWVTHGRPTADPTSSECLLSLQVDSPDEVDGIVGRVEAAGGVVVSAPEQKPWGYTATFSDPDGHLWEAIDSAI
ncbi:VOC family protein [Nocardioides sp. SR21]|uniref:VOC family protein n=1 Tax=Nocardioides sp. SR21 TaxID=2919501 RepID=UPI001FA98328|nr:VOC family protein [Nocardioides sp. SR21]